MSREFRLSYCVMEGNMSMMSSSSALWAKRGNPWYTRREQVETFNRNPETEDPEYDFDRRFHSTDGLRPACPVVSLIEPPAKLDTQVSKPSFQQQADAVVNEYRRREASRNLSAPRPIRVSEHKKESSEFRAAVVRDAQLRAERNKAAVEKLKSSLYVRYTDGTEEERDCNSAKSGTELFNIRRKSQGKDGRKTIERMELWSYATGEILMAWAPRPRSKGNGK